jgi:hypothetical protein
MQRRSCRDLDGADLALLWQIYWIDRLNWIERSRWRGIEFIAGVGVPTTFLPSAGGASNE